MKTAYDFHIHSCLSPCGDEDMTPNNIVNMAKLAGLDIIAVSDHSSCGNCRAAVRAGEKIGLPVVPAMELTTAEEAHILCLFSALEGAEAFGRYVYDKLMDVPNDPAIFGHQRYRDENDEIVGEEPRLLITATEIGVYDAQQLVLDHGGIAIPAHLNKSSYSILSSLGFVAPEMGFSVFEITASCREELLMQEHPELDGGHFIKNSDAHYLEHIGLAGGVLDLPERTAAGVVHYFRQLR